MYKIQVTDEHYDFLKYVHESRWCSYYKQIEEILLCKAKSILLIGVGDGIVPTIAHMINPDITITTFDFDSKLHPDICGDVRQLSHSAGKYDAIICCQVLEHLPYAEFDQCLTQLGMCLKKAGTLILSLPDGGATIKFLMRLPLLPDFKFLHKIPRIWNSTFQFNGEHYWEVNIAKPYTSPQIRKVIGKHFKLEKEYLVENNPYHRFYILKCLKED